MKIKELIKQYYRLILLILIGIAIIFVLGCIINRLMTPKESLPDVASSFFLSNDEGYYSLFNKDGKKVTDYEFINANDFYNGVAKVKNKDNKFGIINESGKYVVKLGTYSNIYQYGSLFKVEDDSKYSLITKKGKKLIKEQDFDIQTFTGVNTFISVLYDNSYIIYNYDGKKVYTFKKNGEETPTSNELGKYGTVYYDNLTIVFNIATGKVISKIKDDKGYCINSVTEDNNTILLNSCSSWYEEDENQEYKLIKNNKLKDIKANCNKMSLSNDQLMCTIDDIRYLLNDKLESTGINSSDITYQNYKNYAIKKDNDIEFIKNGKKVGTLKDAVLADKGYSKDGIYLTYKDSVYTFYNLKGKALFKTSYNKATTFDKLGNAKVSEDGNKYYLINTSGKKVSPEFTSANINGDYYVYSIDNSFGVLDSDGKVLLESNYSSVIIQNKNDKTYAIVNNNDNYELIDLSTKKTILNTKGTIVLYDSYILVGIDEEESYYTYKGTEFTK